MFIIWAVRECLSRRNLFIALLLRVTSGYTMCVLQSKQLWSLLYTWIHMFVHYLHSSSVILHFCLIFFDFLSAPRKAPIQSGLLYNLNTTKTLSLSLSYLGLSLVWKKPRQHKNLSVMQLNHEIYLLKHHFDPYLFNFHMNTRLFHVGLIYDAISQVSNRNAVLGKDLNGVSFSFSRLKSHFHVCMFFSPSAIHSLWEAKSPTPPLPVQGFQSQDLFCGCKMIPFRTNQIKNLKSKIIFFLPFGECFSTKEIIGS